MKKIQYIICGIVCSIIILLFINACTNNTFLGEIYENFSRANENDSLSQIHEWIVYNNLDDNKVKLAIIFKNDQGIKEMELSNGVKIQGNGKSEVAIDYEITPGIEENFKIKLSNNEIINDKLLITEDDIYNQIQERLQNELKVEDYVGAINMKILDENEERQEDVQFIVSQIDDTVQLVCQSGVKSLELVGLNGYNDSDTLITELCNNIFKNNEYVLTSRSITKGENYGIGWYTNGRESTSGPLTGKKPSGPYTTSQYFYYRVCGSLLYQVQRLTDYSYKYTHGAISGTEVTTREIKSEYSGIRPICPVITVNKTSINAVGNNQWYIK